MQELAPLPYDTWFMNTQGGGGSECRQLPTIQETHVQLPMGVAPIRVLPLEGSMEARFPNGHE